MRGPLPQATLPVRPALPPGLVTFLGSVAEAQRGQLRGDRKSVV